MGRSCFCGEGVAGVPQPRRPARPCLETWAWGTLDGGQGHKCFCIGPSSGEMLDLPPLSLCHQGHLWGSVWWWAFRCYGICPNVFAFPRSPAEQQADFLGGRSDSMKQNAVQGACLGFLSCKRRRVPPSHAQFKKNRTVTYYRKSLNRQYYGSVQSIAFCVLMSLSCAFLDINAGWVCGREVLCIYRFVLPVHVANSTCSQLHQAARSVQAFRNSSF